MKFFDALIEFFTYSEKENERRWQEFLKLAEYLTENLPFEVREKLGNKKLNPSVDSNIGIFDFTMTDILWWKEKKSATSFILKDDKEFKGIPLIIFSSLITEEMRIKGKELGADEQMSKPEIGHLVQVIDHLLAEKQL